jgi:oligopeptidase B
VVNPTQDLIAYAEDTLSRRIYTLKIKSIGADAGPSDILTGAAPSMAWSQDGQTLFYIKKHPQTLLEHEVYRHQLTQPSRFGWQKVAAKPLFSSEPAAPTVRRF